ncbi:HtaA domain-containing protein [Phytohabitans kaempferiae]|uniref:HtaA domain-containing protein n=1 Tax=Phytohabitans kaempferiae TaxID=1620943 RepID=A0ABV6MAU4_9ACTN
MGRHTAGRIGRSLRWAAAAAVGAAASIAAVAPASAAPADITGGTLDWGFKASFRAYVSTGNGNPPIGVSDGATRNADGTFRFTATGGTYDAATGATTVHYGGTVVFSYPAHFFEITLSNPTVVLNGTSGSLLGDVDLEVSGGGFEPVHVEQAEIATIALAEPAVAGDTVTWSNLATTMTETGASAFAGFYTAGTALDPLSFAVTAPGGGGEPTGPAVSVTPVSNLDPAGATVTVNGSGFNAAGAGVYVVFGPKRADYWTNAAYYKSAKWVRAGGADVLNPDGTFSTTLEVSATYTDGTGTAVDCNATPCYVLTFAAHGSADRSQDTETAITFAGSGEPGGTAAEQEITAQVLATGPLTLTSAGGSVALSAVQPGAVATGGLNAVTVKDLRGTNAGWSLVGQVEAFSSPLGGTIAADNLGWTPSASVVEDGLAGGAGTVTPGGVAEPGSGLGTARTLCSSAAGVSAGQFQCGADLGLGVPASTVPGDYTATLTLTLS